MIANSCNEQDDPKTDGHRMDDPHTGIQDVTEDSDRKKYDTCRVEKKCGEAGSLSAFALNQADGLVIAR